MSESPIKSLFIPASAIGILRQEEKIEDIDEAIKILGISDTECAEAATVGTDVEGIFKAHGAKTVKKMPQLKRHQPGRKDLPDSNTQDINLLTLEEMSKDVKGNDEVYVSEIEGIYRAYDTKVEKETPNAKRTLAAPLEHLTYKTKGVYEITVGEMLKDVKEKETPNLARGLLSLNETPTHHTSGVYETTVGEMLKGVKDKVPIVDLSEEKSIAGEITIKELTSYIKHLAASNTKFNDLLRDTIINLVAKKVRPKTENYKRQVKDIAKHIAFSGTNVKERDRAMRNAAIIALDKILSGSVLIESVPNYKQDKKADVSMYHYLYVPVSTKESGVEKLCTIQIIAEEDTTRLNKTPLQIDLYDINVRKEVSPLRTTTRSEGARSLWQPRDTEITIREMLENVKNFWGENLAQGAIGSIALPEPNWRKDKNYARRTCLEKLSLWGFSDALKNGLCCLQVMLNNGSGTSFSSHFRCLYVIYAVYRNRLPIQVIRSAFTKSIKNAPTSETKR